MDEPTKREEQPPLLTPEERTEIEKENSELLTEWHRSLSSEEFQAWVQAHREDQAGKIAGLEQEDSDIEAVMRIVEGHGNPIATIESVWRKDHRTLAEAEALDAFKRIKYKMLRLIM